MNVRAPALLVGTDGASVVGMNENMNVVVVELDEEQEQELDSYRLKPTNVPSRTLPIRKER
jgi:hypothetical protein